jgi:hypothetical protein
MVCDQGAERGEPRRSLNLPGRRAALAQRADDLVDLLGRVPGQFLDRLKGRQRAVGVAVMPQPGRTGPDRDHTERVTSRVVQVAGDPGALLSDREQATAAALT